MKLYIFNLKFAAILFVIISSQLTIAQSQFQMTIGGAGNDISSRALIITTDGGYAVAGYTNSFGAGNMDMYVVKFDASGILQWSTTIGGSNADYAYSMIQTTDGGYVVAGTTSSFGAGGTDMLIVKLNGSGILQWSKTIGGAGAESLLSIIQTSDGGFAAAGSTSSFGAGNSDYFIVKLDGSGSLQWSKTVGGTGFDVARSIIQTTDGGYAVSGYTSSFGAGGNDFYIVKLEAGGNLQWSRTIGGAGNDYAFANIIQTLDGGYAVAGETSSFGAGSQDMYVVKLDSSGTLLWSKTMGGTGSESISSIIQTTDGGFAAAGSTSSFGAGNYDMYILKLDSAGSIQWSKTLGGTGSDGSNSIIQGIDGDFIVAGYTNSFGAGGNDLYIVKLNSIGSSCGNTNTPSPILNTGGTSGNPAATILTPSPSVSSHAPLVNSGGLVTAVCGIVGTISISNESPSSFGLYQNYPNPFNPSTKISFNLPVSGFTRLKVYDIMGREVSELISSELNAGSHSVTFNGDNLASGIYYYRLESSGNVAVKKMLLIK